MTQFSIHWILGLNQVSHFWGQVHPNSIYAKLHVCQLLEVALPR
jgi:hypothetical protein